MKKILISILIVLLLILTYVILDKGINVSFIKINSIKDIKNQSFKLDEDLNKANELSSKTYPLEVETLEGAIRNLKISKQDYESRKTNSSENEALGTVEIKTYTIHYLWTILGNYREDVDVKTLTLDLKSTQIKDVYDLDFTLTGNYISITDFIYNIENDEQLNFEIKDFAISSGAKTQVNTSAASGTNNIISNNGSENQTESNNQSLATETSDGITLTATFTVKNIGITLE